MNKLAPSFFSEAVSGHIENVMAELRTHTELLRSLVSTDVQEESQTFRWMRGQATCDATGQVQIPLDNRTGFAMELVSFSAVAGATSNGAVLFFLNSAEPQNLVWSAPQTQYNSDKFTSGMIVPVNGVVVAQFLAVGSGQLAFANVLARRVQISQTKPYAPKPIQGW